METNAATSTRFAPGMVPWNKGRKMSDSEKAKQNHSGLLLGQTWCKGIKLSPQQKSRLNLSGLSLGHTWNKGTKGLMHAWNKGVKHPEAQVEQMRLARLGKKVGKDNPNWRGGVSKIQESIRKSFEYRQWRSDVYTRDEWACQECGHTGRGLNAHHKESFASILKKYPVKTIQEAREVAAFWDINNGITLCKKCHKTKHKAR
jgi:ribosomal protein L37AE/L43A